MRFPGRRMRALFSIGIVSLALLAALPLAGGTTSAQVPFSAGLLSADAYEPATVPTEAPTASPSDPLASPIEALLGALLPFADELEPEATPDAMGQADAIYVVADDDQLADIAELFGVEPAAILAANPSVDPDHLEPGDQLLIPGGSMLTQPAPPPVQAEPTPAPRLTWPVDVPGLITTTFSLRHQGIDIAAPQGTQIRAIAAGTVVWAGWKNNGGGFVVEIQHPNGMHSQYNHNQAVLVRVGQTVAPGQEIALMGMTGNATGPHLDFRIDVAGTFLDPLTLAWTGR